MLEEEKIEVLDEEEAKKEESIKEEEQPRKNNNLFYFIIMILFTIILIKTLNIRIVPYGIKKNTEIPICSEKALQFNYQKDGKHWIGVGAVSLGMIISYINILLGLKGKKNKFITYSTIFLGTILVLGTIFFIKNDIEFENRVQSKKSNIEINCKEK